MTKTEAVTEWLRDAVLQGALKPGTPLTAQDIARELEVSPTPVREAFGMLEAQGLLQRQAHRGVVVVDVYRDLEGVYEVCRALELISARRAAERRDPRSIAEMEGLIVKARAAVRAKNVHQIREINFHFHIALAAASGSRAIVEATTTYLSRSFFTVPMDQDRMVESIDAHVEMLNAVKRGSPTRAVIIAKRHVKRFQQTALATQRRKLGRRPRKSPTKR